ncbi:MAG: Eco57I restriction-modification methylase domain-containing protein [Devosia sp.]
MSLTPELSPQFEKLKQQVSVAQNEEEVRLAWVRALERALGITFQAERGKRDLSYNNVVIEFKSRGKFNGKTNSPAFREAMEQRLLPYILKTAKAEQIDESDYIGIAVDGNHLAFVQVIAGVAHHQHLLPVTQVTFGMVVEACRKSYRRAVTAQSLVEDFGHDSERGLALMRALVAALSDALKSASCKKIQMLFEEWRTLYGQVAELSKEQLKNINGTLRFSFAGRAADDVPARLFVIHTFNSLLIKLLGAEIVAAHGLASGLAFAQELATIEDDGVLLARLRDDIEGGRFFEATGIYGFVEEAIFSWYLDAAILREHQEVICAAIRDVLAELSLYRTDSLSHTGDVLRDFYQDLVPDTLRKSLGEFYTPQWLVEAAVDKANVKDWLGVRALDPTCGSGSFLVELIRRKRKAALANGMSPSATVEMLAQSVWGFDLNPLAVQSSRTNFLMAIADLLKATPGQRLEIPVLLADAIYSPAPPPGSGESVVEYQIGSPIANLRILLPSQLAYDRNTLDDVFETMGELVEAGVEYDQCSKALVERKIVSESEVLAWNMPLQETYNQVLGLHRKSWNGIWFRIVRNFFWSATAGEFDLVVGNPPWVRWSRLPDAYRERVKPTCEQYTIFSETPHHGGNELDISGMITYTAADKWLKRGGCLVFVITQTHFQSPSSQGFRRFRINETDRLLPSSVDDLKALKPFPDAANKTSIAVFRKGDAEPKYPVPYRVWSASKGSRAIPTHLSLKEVMSSVVITMNEATPVGGEGSPWAVLPPGRFKKLRKLAGKSAWVQGRKGITADLNGVYFVNVAQTNEQTGLVEIATRPEAGKTDIGKSRKFWIEPTLLYPLLKGASDFEACYLKPKHERFVIVPNKGITHDAGQQAEARINANCPKTKKYFKDYEALLRARSTWSKRMPSAPYYAVYNVGSYTFAPYKVVWAEQSGNFSSAVATCAEVPLGGMRVFVPDHKLFFVEFSKQEPAYFLCGLLNSSMVKEFVESHNISIQMGDIFKHMSLPQFDAGNASHLRLSSRSLATHLEHNADARKKILTEVRDLANTILA